MSVRNRPRNGPTKDEDEEINMYNQIKKDIEKLATMQKRSIEITEKIKKKEVEMADLDKARKLTVKEIDELQELYREQVKLSSEEGRMLKEEPTDLIRNVDILKALSEATSSQRNAPAPPKVRNKSKPGPSQAEPSADSPGPSPGIPSGRVKGSSIRSGSVASMRDGKDARSDDNDGAKGLHAERQGKFTVGAEVAYKQAKPREDGSQWIQCIIRGITESGNKKKYEYLVQDPEPDENGTPGAEYRATATALIAIPLAGTPLPDFPAGKIVLARYPETTTFYRAEVVGLKKDVYRLKFDEDGETQSEVDRRYVLDVGGR